MLDTDSIWSSAFIVDVLKEENIEIRYDGWDDVWNEILKVDSSRVAPIYTHTSRLKCFVSLVHPTSRKKMDVKKNGSSSFWPCILHTRIPHGENASTLLKIEKNVFVQPYRSGLLPKHIRNKIMNGGIWLETKHIHKWELLNHNYHEYPCNFELAYNSCLEDKSVPGHLHENIFMEGSCIYDAYFVNTSSETNKLIDLTGWESDLVDLSTIDSRVGAEIVCKEEEEDCYDKLQSSVTSKVDNKCIGLWAIFPEIDPIQAAQNVAQVLPSRYKYAAKQVCEFFMFCFERQRIWFQKKSNMPRPWTKDILLHSKHFCNLFRELDRGTQYLHRHIVALHKEYNIDNSMESKHTCKKRKQEKIFPIGTRLIKGCDFEGKVVDIPSEESPYYKILYMDGDQEEMNKDEVLSYLKKDDAADCIDAKHECNIGTIVMKRFDLEARVIHFDQKSSLYTIEFDVNGVKEEVSHNDLKNLVLALESTDGPSSTNSNNAAVSYVSEVLFMVICFRLINRIETFDILNGIPRIKDWKSFVKKLENLQKKQNFKIFTCAHQVMGFRRFVSTINSLLRNDCAVLLKLENNLQIPIRNKDLEGVTRSLQKIENIGPFFAWQITCDLLQSNILGDCHEHGYTLFGPGAKNGLRYIFPKTCDELEICKFLVQNQSRLFDCLQLDFKSVAGERRLTLKVIEHTLCEFQKYVVSYENAHKLQQISLRNYYYTAPKSHGDYCNTCYSSSLKGESTNMEHHTVNTMVCIDCCRFLDISKNHM